MSLGRAALVLLGLGLAGAAPRPAAAEPPAMRLVAAGLYVGSAPEGARAAVQAIDAFWLDERPVTNAEFLAFVREHPRWRRSRAARHLVDGSYLAHWAGDLELGPRAGPRQPVTFVSWFAAHAYCRARGARLPTQAEWEWAALPDGSAEQAAIHERALAFYGRPRRPLPDAGGSPANRYGVRDQHGVVFEWVSDFQGSGTAQVGRGANELQQAAFCGAAAAGAADVRDYAAFVRRALRESLQPRFALHHLGFRCARSMR